MFRASYRKEKRYCAYIFFEPKSFHIKKGKKNQMTLLTALPLILVFLAAALGLQTQSESQSKSISPEICPPSYWVPPLEVTPFEVFLKIGDPLVFPLNITGPFDIQPTDIYFLWDTSAFSRDYSYHYWKSGARRLQRVMNDTIDANPGVQFGLGFFRTKRLHNIGTGSDYVFQHVVNITSNISHVQRCFNNSRWSLVAAVSPINSAIEAAQHVMLNADRLGFRPGARKIIFLATSTMFGQAGDVAVRTVNPLMQTDPGGGPPFPFPRADDGDRVLEDDCTLTGLVCYESWAGAITPCSATTLVAVAPPNPLLAIPNIGCTCPYSGGNLTVLNVTQFARGSCEDFPSQAQIPLAAAMAGGFDMIAFLPEDELLQGIVPIYTSLVNSVSPNGAVLQTLDLNNTLPPLVPIVVDTQQFNISWNIPEISNYTFGPCDQTQCTILFVFTGTMPGTETIGGEIVVDGYPYTINVYTCGSSPSSSKSQSFSMSATISNSQSRSATLSNSDSNSPEQTQSLSQSLSQSDSRSGSDSQSASFTRSQSRSRSPSDSLSQSSSGTLPPTESNSQSRSLGLTQSASQSQSRSVSFSDSRSRSDSNTLPPTESNSQSQSRSVSSSDSRSRSDSSTLPPTESNSQSQSQTTSRSQSRSLTSAETQTLTKSRSQSSSLSASETRSQSLSRAQTDSQSQSQSRSLSRSKSQTQSESSSFSEPATQSASNSQSSPAIPTESPSGPIPTESPTDSPSESPPAFTPVPTESQSESESAAATESQTPSGTPAPSTEGPPTLGWIIGLSAAMGVLIPCSFCCILLWGRRRRRRRRKDGTDGDY
jgi:hypothetical protein